MNLHLRKDARYLVYTNVQSALERSKRSLNICFLFTFSTAGHGLLTVEMLDFYRMKLLLLVLLLLALKKIYFKKEIERIQGEADFI